MKSAYLCYIAALLLFGSNGIIAQHITLTSTEIVLYRTFIGSAFLFLIFLLSKTKWTFYKEIKSLGFLFISGISMGLSWIFLYTAYLRIGVAASSLLYYCGPVIVLLFAPLLFRESISKHKLIGFFSAFCGLILINGSLLSAKADFPGLICGLLSAVMYSLMVISNKKAANISGLENSLLQLFFSFLTVAFFTILRGNFSGNIPTDSILPLLFLGIINTGLGCYLYFSKLDCLTVHSVSILGYLEPLSAVILSVFFLHESMTVLRIIGAILLLGGSAYAELTAETK